MAGCADIVSPTIQRVQAVAPAGSGLTQFLNGQMSVPATSSAAVLPPNAARRFAQVENNSGSALNISLGVAAGATSMVFPNGSIYTIDPSNPFFGSVFVYNPTAGALLVSFSDFI